MSRQPVATGEAKRPARRRRSAAEARGEILDAAARRLAASGPEGLRLQEIAADVGLSHPAILHHFGSREGLVRALVARAVARIEADLLAAIARPAGEGIDVPGLLGRVLRTLGDEGHARLLAWLVLSGRADPEAAGGEARLLGRAAEAAHARRSAAFAEQGRAVPPFEDSLFVLVLGAFALVGEALMGELVFPSAGLDDHEAASRRFRVWLARLLEERMAAGPPAPVRARRAKRHR